MMKTEDLSALNRRPKMILVRASRNGPAAFERDLIRERTSAAPTAGWLLRRDHGSEVSDSAVYPANHDARARVKPLKS